MEIAGLLLAAGAGTRLGRPKALVELDGALLVERGLRALADGGCAPVHVVLGAAEDEVRKRADLAGATVVSNPDWPTGMASSLRRGLRSLPETTGAVVVALVDQPHIGPEVIRRLCAAPGATIAVATYRGARRNPVLLGRGVWDGVCAAASGDVGARGYLAEHPDEVTEVECGDIGSPEDIDVPADLAHASRPRDQESR